VSLNRQIAIIGVGNALCRDEGVGVHVVQDLQSRVLPPGVEVFDAGTAVLDVLLDAADYRKIVIVDAVCSGGEPGTIYRLPFPDFSREVEETGTSLHEMTLLGTLNMARLQIESTQIPRQLPEIVIIGIEPQQVSVGTELSACVQEKLKTLRRAVLEEAGC
jgi:hydrogenase maturation protease